MKIIADENMAYLSQYFSTDEVVLKPGREITQADLIDADILLVRSVTKVNQALLQNTKVKFVGSAATGLDHLDTAWLDQAGIKWYAAQGCNARAVVEYVIAVVASLKVQAILPDKPLRAAVIGVGLIGSQVAEVLKVLGFEVILCDPIRALNESDFQSVAIEDLKDLDLVTLHTPLTHAGPFPTHHLINKSFLLNQKKNCVLLNAGRGDVINFSDLCEYGETLYWCLDVWEHEPIIDMEVLGLALIATPHIAGYSIQSKLRGMDMVAEALRQKDYISLVANNNEENSHKVISFNHQKANWYEVILRIYDPLVTTQKMKNALVSDASGQHFDELRKLFNGRDEFAYVSVCDVELEEVDKELLKALGVNI